MAKKDKADWHNGYIAHFIATGQLWRAKESLQCQIRQELFNTGLYEDYGRILLLMGDLPEAGKYLFLCGERRPEYQEAIELFLFRHGKEGWRSLTTAFPRRARKLSIESFPPAVAVELAKRSYPPGRGEILPPKTKTGPMEYVWQFIFGCFWLLLAISCILGFAQIAQFLLN